MPAVLVGQGRAGSPSGLGKPWVVATCTRRGGGHRPGTTETAERLLELHRLHVHGALGVLGEQDRADTEEEHRQLRPRGGRVAQEQRRRDRETDGGEERGDVRAHPERDEYRQPGEAQKCRVRARLRLLLLDRVDTSADTGDERGQARHQQFHLEHAQPHRARGGLAPAHRVERHSGRRSSEVDDEDREDREHREREVQEAAISGGEVRPRHDATGAVLGERVQGEHQSLHQQTERQRHQRDVQVAESDREEADDQTDRARDDPAHDDGEQDRHAPLVRRTTQCRARRRRQRRSRRARACRPRRSRA